MWILQSNQYTWCDYSNPKGHKKQKIKIGKHTKEML